MSGASPTAGDLFIETLVDVQSPEPLPGTGTPGMTEPVGEEELRPTEDLGLAECLEGSNQVALRLACIGDEMDLRLRSPRLAQLPGMAIHSLALTYSQTGVRGVLRSLIHCLTSLREAGRSWSPHAARPRVCPAQACTQLLPAVLLAALLLGGALHLLLQ